MTESTSDENFQKDVLESDIPVLVDFWAEWCGPCKSLSPIVDEIAAEMAGKIKVLKCDIDANPEVPTKYGVRGIPNLILFKGGENVDSKVGALPKQDLINWLESYL